MPETVLGAGDKVMNGPKTLFSWRPHSSGRRQTINQIKEYGRNTSDQDKCPTDNEDRVMDGGGGDHSRLGRQGKPVPGA